MTNSDGTLVRNLRGPDSQQAARALYRSYGGELYGFALRRLRDEGLAEELVQDVFTRAWRSAGQFESARGSVRTWLYAIARNAVIDIERRRGRRPKLAAHESHLETVDPAEPIETALLRFQIQLAISRLTFEHRQVIELVHFRGLSLAEIAELTGLAVGTVKSRLHYATRSLRLALEELEVIP
ncbi:MAG: RNA polymerase sigma factor [Solirubrobacteraceae bacterium]